MQSNIIELETLEKINIISSYLFGIIIVLNSHFLGDYKCHLIIHNKVRSSE